jgi:hypothetical protein
MQPGSLHKKTPSKLKRLEGVFLSLAFFSPHEIILQKSF